MSTTWAPPIAPPVSKAWRIEWNGRSYHEQDLTGQHLAVLALLNGADDWSNLDMAQMSPTLGPVRLMLMVAAFLVVEVDTDDEAKIGEVIESVRRTPAEQLLAALHFD